MSQFKVRKHKGRFLVLYTDRRGYTRPVSGCSNREAANAMANQLEEDLMRCRHDLARGRTING